ncbi:hypothetical protein HMPREF3150_04608 [Pseudomonas aeruginosa]|nr:hypothetical protein HMPREF3150_04608 [Pseudomonas aeruginosa]
MLPFFYRHRLPRRPAVRPARVRPARAPPRMPPLPNGASRRRR